MAMIDTLFETIGSFRRESVTNYIDLCHNCTDSVLVTDSGALLTVLKVNGLQAIDGEQEWRDAATNIETGLSSLFSREGVTFQWVFERDDNKTAQALVDATKPSFQTMKALNLDLEDIYKENIVTNREFVCHETSYIAIWSDMRLIDSQLAKNRLKENAQKAVGISLYLKDCPNLFKIISELIVKHESLVEDFLYSMGRGKVSSETLTSHDACAAMKLQYLPDTSREWLPSLIGDARHVRTLTNGEPNEDGSELFWTPIKKQIANKPIDYVKPGVVKLGNQLSRSGAIEVFPIKLRPFRDLIANIEIGRASCRERVYAPV